MADTKRILIVENDAEASEVIRRGLEAEDTLEFELTGSLAQLRGSLPGGSAYVESAEIHQRMAEIGVDFVQGYGVGRPEPIGEMGAMEALRALGR